MTDAEITRALGVSVMEWKSVPLTAYPTIPPRIATWGLEDQNGLLVHHWDPLTNDADACTVLDKMAADGWECLLNYGPDPYWTVVFERDTKLEDMDKVEQVDDICRRRAIAIAALKAKGAYQA